jgi:hypothetical protein
MRRRTGTGMRAAMNADVPPIEEVENPYRNL